MKRNRRERIRQREIKATRLLNLELARTTKFMCYDSKKALTVNTFVTVSSKQTMQDRNTLIAS